MAAAVEYAGTDTHGSGHEILTLREANGWSVPDQPLNSQSRISLDAKIAALLALGELPPLTPVASVSYESIGRLLVIADSAPRAAQAIEGLDETLAITVLWAGALPAPVIAETEIVIGKLVKLAGYLGAFELLFESQSAGHPQMAPFDLVLDLRAAPLFRMHQPPQGYFHVGDGTALARALAELPEMIGELGGSFMDVVVPAFV